MNVEALPRVPAGLASGGRVEGDRMTATAHEVLGRRPASRELPVVVIGAGPVGLAAATT